MGNNLSQLNLELGVRQRDVLDRRGRGILVLLGIGRLHGQTSSSRGEVREIGMQRALLHPVDVARLAERRPKDHDEDRDNQEERDAQHVPHDAKLGTSPSLGAAQMRLFVFTRHERSNPRRTFWVRNSPEFSLKPYAAGTVDWSKNSAWLMAAFTVDR